MHLFVWYKIKKPVVKEEDGHQEIQDTSEYRYKWKWDNEARACSQVCRRLVIHFWDKIFFFENVIQNVRV